MQDLLVLVDHLAELDHLEVNLSPRREVRSMVSQLNYL